MDRNLRKRTNFEVLHVSEHRYVNNLLFFVCACNLLFNSRQKFRLQSESCSSSITSLDSPNVDGTISRRLPSKKTYIFLAKHTLEKHMFYLKVKGLNIAFNGVHNSSELRIGRKQAPLFYIRHFKIPAFLH